ncbi:hypothetical protein CYMTET_40734 [Cymbomonas tetramitiformis]|uniref:Uncharacterized protein n=1 Tax=Cymbomonas tetramitiformis TaxID=36881 RepID=A0AAE0C8T2_9CHLO|nr:hypothetical protein CYMTET_40734 [Cymbomonas tetramitiformis]
MGATITFGGAKQHRFSASPLAEGGNWSQGHARGKQGAHRISFHACSRAFVPQCARCPPGHWHDSANCPTADTECVECDIEDADEADEPGSAFQTAFDAEDDLTFARLCARHDQPLDCTISLTQRNDIPHLLHMYRRRVTVCSSLRRLVVVVGGGEQHFPMVHFGSAATDVIEPADVRDELPEETGGVMYPKQFIDAELPFEQTFMHKMQVCLNSDDKISDNMLSMQSFSTNPNFSSIDLTHQSELSILDDDTDSDFEEPTAGGTLTHLFAGAAAEPALCTPLAPPPAVSGDFCGYQNGAVAFCPLDIDTAGIFTMDSGGLYFDSSDIFILDTSIDYNNFYSSELLVLQ